MENQEALRQRVLRERQILTRLCTAAVRLADAQIERTWAIVAAHDQGLSIRQIARAAGLSAARVHQLLVTTAAQQIPRWLTYLRQVAPADEEAAGVVGNSLADQLQAEVAALRQCGGWLEQLERGAPVVVNLRLETDPQTEFVRFDGARVRRVLDRIAADLEEVAQRERGAAPGALPAVEDRQARRRRR